MYTADSGRERDLGVHITEDLKPSMQCVRSGAKARCVMGMINRNFKRLDNDDFLLIYKTYVWPRMEYCVQACSPHLKKDIECLEKVQRAAIKRVQGLISAFRFTYFRGKKIER